MLTESLLIGRGGHKDVYDHPEDFTRCIKIIRDENDLDWKRELRYRRSRMRRCLTSKLLPAYYGPIETSLGRGYVFERVFDFDGTPSRSLDDILAGAAKKADDMAQMRPRLETALAGLRQAMHEERIIVTNTDLTNVLVQRTAPGVCRFRIVDNIGSPVLIPLFFYIDRLAHSHIDRYWRRFLDTLRQKHPVLFTEDLRARLLR